LRKFFNLTPVSVELTQKREKATLMWAKVHLLNRKITEFDPSYIIDPRERFEKPGRKKFLKKMAVPRIRWEEYSESTTPYVLKQLKSRGN